MPEPLVPQTWEPTSMEVRAMQANGFSRSAAEKRLQVVGPLIAARALREAADVCESDAKGPISGTGIVGPLQVMGIAQGIGIAANILRRRAAALEGRVTSHDA